MVRCATKPDTMSPTRARHLSKLGRTRRTWRSGGCRRCIQVIKEYFATELEAAVAHDVFCDQRGIKCLSNFVRVREEPEKRDLTDPQVLEEEEERLASIDAQPKKKPVTMSSAFLQTMREKCATITLLVLYAPAGVYIYQHDHAHGVTTQGQNQNP